MPSPHAAVRIDDSVCVSLQSYEAVDLAMGRLRAIASQFGFPPVEANLLVSAASELATNTLRHAEAGRMRISPTPNGLGLAVLVEDDGPGIPDRESALRDGFTTRTDGLGLGLGVVTRAVEDFVLTSTPDGGTQAEIRKYLPLDSGRYHYGIAGLPAAELRVNRAMAFQRPIRGESLLCGILAHSPCPGDAGPIDFDLQRSLKRAGSSQPASVAAAILGALETAELAEQADLLVALVTPRSVQVAAWGQPWWTLTGVTEEVHRRAHRGQATPTLEAIAAEGPITLVAGTRDIAASGAPPQIQDAQTLAEDLVFRGAQRTRDSKLMVIRRP